MTNYVEINKKYSRYRAGVAYSLAYQIRQSSPIFFKGSPGFDLYHVASRERYAFYSVNGQVNKIDLGQRNGLDLLTNPTGYLMHPLIFEMT